MAFLPPGTMFAKMLAKIASSRPVLPVWEDAQLRVGHHVDMWRRAERDKLWRTISWKCFFFQCHLFWSLACCCWFAEKKKSPTYPCTGLSGWSWVSGLALLTLWCDKCQSFQATICYSCIRSQCSSSSLSFANFYDRERKNVKPLNTFSPTAPIGPTPPGGPCGPCNMSNSKCKFYRYQYVAPVQPICHTHISSTGTLRTSGTRRTRRTLRERKWY